MSCAVIRTRLPARRTLPSSTALTFELLADRRGGRRGLALERERRRARRDRSPGTCASALMISSVIPSLKYSFSGSALMFANGSTAIGRARCLANATATRTPGRSARPRSARSTRSARSDRGQRGQQRAVDVRRDVGAPTRRARRRTREPSHEHRFAPSDR